MSVPNRSKNGIDDSLSHAPRWVRQSPEQSTSTHASSTAPLITTGATPRITNAPPMASGIGGYNIDLPPPRSRPFAGDVAIKDMRRQLSLDPQGVPEPPVQGKPAPVVRWYSWLSFVAVMAAIIGLGALLITFLDETWKPAGGIAGVSTPPREGLPGLATLVRPARLVVESQKGLANDPLPPGVSLNDAPGGKR